MEFQLLFKGTAHQTSFLASAAPDAQPASTCTGDAAQAADHGASAAIISCTDQPRAAAHDSGPEYRLQRRALEQHAEELVKQYCTFPEVRRHPRQAAMEAQTRAWLADLYGRRWPASRVQRLLDFQLEVLGCVFYPRGLSDARSLSLFKIMHWFLLDDDVFDDAHLFGHDYEAARRFACRQFRAMFGDEIKEAQAMGLIGPGGYDADIEEDPAIGLDAMARAQLELVVEVGVQFTSELQAQGLSRRQVERLREAVAEDLVGVTSVVRWRQEKRLPSVEEYIHLRRLDGGSKLALLGCELDVGVELDDETLQHPLIKRLNDLTCDQVVWVNDLLTFKRECHNNDYISLLAVLHYNNIKKAAERLGSSSGNHDLHAPADMADFSEALVEARCMIKACDEERAGLVRNIAAWRPDLQPYVEATNFAITGITYWTLFSSRYQNPEPL